MKAKIFVTGGTGGLGSHTVPLLLAAEYDLRILSRSARENTESVEYVTGDLLAGDGLDEALAGIETVLHMAGAQKGDDIATRNLAQAAARAGVKHIVYVSVIGAETVPVRWLQMKGAAEQAIRESGVPYTILRAAQFHDLTLKTVRVMAKLPVVPNPGGLRIQSVDARDVAARLAELVAGPPAGLVADIAGPDVVTLGDLVRSYMKASGKHRLLMPLRIPGKAGKAYRAGVNLTLDGALVGAGTWDDFLAAHVG